MRHLGLGLVEVHQRQPQQAGGAGEREAGAGRLVAEDGDRQPAAEDAGVEVGAVELLEDLGRQQHRPEVGLGLLPGEQQVLLVEVGAQRAELLDQSTDAVGHRLSPGAA